MNFGVLERKIDCRRKQLHRLADEKGLASMEVLEASRRLDEVIVAYQRLLQKLERKSCNKAAFGR
ncbi:aspartyl-phosphate phosphatase Spo0E family protein [Azotosporobacter soli]|uniref:aspartyl-phosphate phosphatase Spo0E family protein n=1 Tax=Azotosporobacter soli TaxID=3055040 RepID=UPI0031FE73AC